MSLRIPLPNLNSTPNAKAHPYPVQIAIQTMEFLQASIFYFIFMDIAAGESIHLPDGIAKIEQIITDKLHTKDDYYKAWGYIEKYKVVLEHTIFQSVLISLNSHWDWYMRKLGEFIIFASEKSGTPKLSTQEARRISRIAMLPIIEQVGLIETVLQFSSVLSSKERADLCEMSLVRNLGLHNRWEVDEKYLRLTSRTRLEVGDIRVFDRDELWEWHNILMLLVSEFSDKVAIAFVKAPPFP